MDRRLTRRDFLKGAGAAAIGLALPNIFPRKTLGHGSGCPKYRGVAPVDWDYVTYPDYRREYREQWLDEIVDLGANSVEINLAVKAKPDGRVGYNMYDPPHWVPMSDERTMGQIKDYVQQAQQKGFKVILDIPSLMADRPIDRSFNLDRFFSEFEKLSLKWADIAEELGVEGYCPEGELGAIEAKMGLQRVYTHPNNTQWYHSPRVASFIKQLIPKVRERYSGNIIIQENPYQAPDIEFDGADYVGLHIYLKGPEENYYDPSSTPSKWRNEIRAQIDKGQSVAQRDRCKAVMVTEVGVGCMPDPGEGCGIFTIVTEQQQKKLAEIFFQEAWDEVDGIYLCGWGGEEFKRQGAITNKPAEDVVRRYYRICPADLTPAPVQPTEPEVVFKTGFEPGETWPSLNRGLSIEEEDGNHVLRVAYGQEKGIGMIFPEVRSDNASLQTRANINKGSSLMSFSATGGAEDWYAYSLALGPGHADVFKGSAHELKILQSVDMPVEEDTWFDVKVEIEDRKKLQVYINDNKIIDFLNSEPLPNIKFNLDARSNSQILYDDVLIRKW